MIVGILATSPRFLGIGQDSAVHCAKKKWIFSIFPSLSRYAK